MTIIQDHEIAGRMPLLTTENRRKTVAKLKNQTRRVMKPQPPGWTKRIERHSDGVWVAYQDTMGQRIGKCPYRVGDIRVMCEPLESVFDPNHSEHIAFYSDDSEQVVSSADGGFHPLWWRWKRDYLTSVHMPNEAGRYLYRITGVKAERLQDISEEDAIAEGIRIEWRDVNGNNIYGSCGQMGFGHSDQANSAVGAFAYLWDSINAKPKRSKHNPYTGQQEQCYVSYPWEDIRETREKNGLPWYVIGNPWNFAYSYEAVE